MQPSEKLTQFYWIVSIIFFIPAAFLIVMNWIIVRYNRKNRETGKSSSGVPFFGGIFGAVSLWIVPVPQVNAFWWIPLIVDYGCLLCLIETAIFWHRDYKQRTNEHNPDKSASSQLPNDKD